MTDKEKKDAFRIDKKVVGFNAIAAAASKLINMLVVLWAQHILLTKLSADDFSIYPLISILVYFLPLVTGSFTSPAQRFVTAAYAKDKRNEITEIVSTIVTLLLIPLAMIVIGGIALIIWLDSAFEINAENLPVARTMFGIIIAATSIKLFMQPFCVAFYATQRLVLFHGIALSGEFVRLFSLALLFYFLGPRVLWVVVTDAVLSTSIAIVLAVCSRRMMPEIRFSRSSVNLSRAREFLSFGVFDVGISFSRMMRTALPIWLLNRFDTPVAVNTFHVGQSAFRQAQKAWIPMRGTLGPPMIGMAATNQDERLRRTFYKGGRIAIWMTMLLCTPLIVFHNEVATLYAGSKYIWAGPVMAILLLRYPLQLMNAFLPQLARAKGIPGRVSVPMIICELTSAVTIAIAIIGFRYSVVGAAVCSLVVTALFELFVLAPIGNAMMNGKMRRSLTEGLLPGVIPALGGGFAMLAVNYFYSPTSALSLALACLPGAVVYILLVFFCLRPDDRQDFEKIVIGSRAKLRPPAPQP